MYIISEVRSLNWTAIGIGALIGGLFRYMFEVFIPTLASIPLGTLTVNLLGCLLLGFIYFAAEQQVWPTWLRLGLGTGMIGAFTTFSTFSLELAQLAQSHLLDAVLYGLISIIGGLIFVMIGEWLGGTLFERRASTEEVYS